MSEPLYASAATLTRIYRVPARTLRRWAAEDGWPSTKLRGRRYYAMDAVDRSYWARGRRRRDTLKQGA